MTTLIHIPPKPIKNKYCSLKFIDENGETVLVHVPDPKAFIEQAEKVWEVERDNLIAEVCHY